MKYKYNFVMLLDDMALDNFVNEKLITINRFAKKIYVNNSAKNAIEFLNGLTSSKTTLKTYPELIFVDINMPLMDGYEFIANLKQDLAKHAVKPPKLILLTSSVFQNERQKAHGVLGEIIFLTKPLTKEMLNEL